MKRPRKWGCDSGLELIGVLLRVRSGQNSHRHADALLDQRKNTSMRSVRSSFSAAIVRLAFGASLFCVSAAQLRADHTFTVGVNADFPSLTNPDGVFDFINQNDVTENVIINIISDLENESGVVPLNSFSGGFAITIKPSGAPRTVTGTSERVSSSLIKLNGTDNVTLDGSLSGGSDRSLTLTFARIDAGGVVIWIASASPSDGASGNTIKNCIINSRTGSGFPAIAGILAGSGNASSPWAQNPQDNNTIQNNNIS